MTETQPTERSIVDVFQAAVKSHIDEDGVYPHMCLMKQDDGITFASLALSPLEAMSFAISKKDEYDELIFALDRKAQPEQGTEFDDVLTCFYHKKGEGWKYGVINYQAPPKDLIVRDIDWNNDFWNNQMSFEIENIPKRYDKARENERMSILRSGLQ